MCLDRITRTILPPYPDKPTIVYKFFRNPCDSGELLPLYNSFTGSYLLSLEYDDPSQERYTKNNEYLHTDDLENGRYGTYPYGYHAFRRLKDAKSRMKVDHVTLSSSLSSKQNLVLCRVELSNIHTEGMDSGYYTLVGTKMKPLSVLYAWRWRYKLSGFELKKVKLEDLV